MGLWSRASTLFRTKASAAIDRAEDPHETLDYAYSQQQELLRKVRLGLIDVSTSKRQLDAQVSKIEARLPRFEDEARRAVAAARHDLALLALQRRRNALQQLADLRAQLMEVQEEERRLIATEQNLSARVEEFKSRRQVMAARYTAADAQVRVSEALSGVSGELADLGMALGRAEEKAQRLQARAAALDEMLDPGSLGRSLAGEDDVERELQRMAAADAIQQELAVIKGELAAGESPVLLEGSQPPQQVRLVPLNALPSDPLPASESRLRKEIDDVESPLA